MSRAFHAFVNWKGMGDGAKVGLVVGVVCALSVFQVYGGVRSNASKAGHHYMSSEKPQALRNETERDLEVERAKMARAAPPASATAAVAAAPPMA